MGLQIDRENFSEDDFRRFSERLRENLAALEGVLARPGFGEGEATLGAELEVSTVDAQGRPILLCDRLLGKDAHPGMQAEIDCFNLEFNLDHVPFSGRPFSALEENLRRALAVMEKSAAVHGGDVVSIGILPTLREEDLQTAAMTDNPRYRALSAVLRKMRGCPFLIRIDGPEPLSASCTDVTMEGANNSFQVHWRVPPAEYAALFNAAQLATAPVLAICGNSPFFLRTSAVGRNAGGSFQAGGGHPWHRGGEAAAPRPGSFRHRVGTQGGHGTLFRGSGSVSPTASRG